MQLTQRGVLKRAKECKKELRGRYDLQANVVAYIRHLRARTERNGADAYADARALRMAAQALIEEQRAQQMHGTLLPRERVVSVMTNLLSTVKNHMLAIPSRVARKVLGQTDYKFVVTTLRDAQYLGLRELSSFDPSEFTERDAKHRERVAANGEKLDAIDD